MIKEYKCKETFYVPDYDGDGRSTGEKIAIEKGSHWREDTTDRYRIFGGKETVKLKQITPDSSQWLEITRETLEHCFEPIAEI